MKMPDAKIGTREFISIIIISLGLKVADMTPHNIYNIAGNAGWIVPLLWIGMIGIPFLVLLSLQKKYNKGLIELITYLLGKTFANFLIVIFFIITFLITVYISKSSITIINVLFYPFSPFYLFYILLLAISLYIARKGIVAIGRLAWLIIPITQVVLLILLFTVYSEVDVDRIFPVFGTGFTKILKGSITNTGIFVNIFLISALFVHVRTVKNYQFATIFSLFYSLFFLSFFLAYYIMVFDYPSTVRMAYPYQELTRIAKFGETMRHLDAVFLVFWIMGTVIRFATYLYLLSFFFGKLFNSKKSDMILIPITGLVLLTGLLPDNVYTAFPIRMLEIKITSAVFLLLPFILWVASLWKGRRKNGNKQQANH